MTTWTNPSRNTTSWAIVSNGPDGGFVVVSATDTASWSGLSDVLSSWLVQTGRAGAFWPRWFFNELYWPLYFWPVTRSVAWTVPSRGSTSWTFTPTGGSLTWSVPSSVTSTWTAIGGTDTVLWSTPSEPSTAWDTPAGTDTVTWS